jgi:TPR repeat protein
VLSCASMPSLERLLTLALTVVPGIASSGDDPRIEELAASCRAGTAGACTQLAHVFARGEGVARSLERAARLFKDGCSGGDGEACSELAVLWGLGDGVVAADEVEAQRLWRRACDLGHAPACFGLALAREFGEPGAASSDEALALVSKACEDGYAEACKGMAAAHALGQGMPKDPTRAEQLWQRALELRSRACDAGSAEACLEVADMYTAPMSGLEAARRPPGSADPGRNLDYRRRAEALLRAGCDRGDLGTAGCVGLGGLYAENRAAEFDFERALAPLAKACRAGFYEGCEGLRSLESLYRGGEGMTRDDARLARLRDACVVPEACGGRPGQPVATRDPPLGDELGSSRIRDRLLETALDRSASLDARFEAAESLSKMGFSQPVAPLLEIRKVHASHDDMWLIHLRVENEEVRMLDAGRHPTREEIEALARETLATARRRDDAWGRPLRTAVHPKDSKYFPWGVDVLSDGPDGRSGTEDDLSTAEPPWVYDARRYPSW